MSESEKKVESGLPGDIPPNEWKFLEAMRGFEKDMEFILREKSNDLIDKICDSLYKLGLETISELLEKEEKSLYALMPFNVSDMVEPDIAKRVDKEINNRVMKLWELFFRKEIEKRKHLYRGLTYRFKIQYGLIQIGDEPGVQGVFFIKDIS